MSQVEKVSRVLVGVDFDDASVLVCIRSVRPLN